MILAHFMGKKNWQNGRTRLFPLGVLAQWDRAASSATLLAANWIGLLPVTFARLVT
jgi:hypothetical protein